MRTATTVEASGPGGLDLACEAERIGLDVCWVAEAWGSDALTALGWLAGRTERMLLGSGVLQVGTRTPVAIAQAALTLADLSDGRFLLGLGVSGPQVVEGLHGVAFARPRTRLRETVDVVRLAMSGAKVAYAGEAVAVPRPGGEGRPMRLSAPPRTDVPIYLATLSPRTLELTGEIADGWLGTSFDRWALSSPRRSAGMGPERRIRRRGPILGDQVRGSGRDAQHRLQVPTSMILPGGGSRPAGSRTRAIGTPGR